MKKIIFLCLLVLSACSTNDPQPVIKDPGLNPLGMSPGTDFIPRIPSNGVDCSMVWQWDAPAISAVYTPDQYGTSNALYTVQPKMSGFYAGTTPVHDHPSQPIVLTFRVTNYGQSIYKFQINYGTSFTLNPGSETTFTRVYFPNGCGPLNIPTFTVYFRRQQCGNLDPLGGGYYFAPVFSLLSVADYGNDHVVKPTYYGETPVTLNGYQIHNLTCP